MSSVRPVSPGQHELNQSLRRNESTYPDVRLRDSFDFSRSRTTSSLPPSHSLYTQSSSANATSQLSPASSTSSSFSSTSSLSSTSSSSADPLVPWVSASSGGIRPVDFQPTGSFKVLKESGKLVDKYGQLYPEYKGREKQGIGSKQHIPGYTGFVRGSQHISGRTYGESTKRALSTDYREVVCTSPIPSSPQQNRKIRQDRIEDTFVQNMFGEREYHIPGYTGFVPGVRSSFAKTYGSATGSEITKLKMTNTFRGSSSDSHPGFARTAFQRKMLSIDSAPVPGGLKTHRPPDMYIPAHLKYLKFFPM